MNSLNPAISRPEQLNNSFKTRVIEIIGPPGVGKSTLHRALCKTWNRNRNWVYPEFVLSSMSPKSSFPYLSKFQIRKWMNRGPRTLPIEFGLKYIEDNRELVEFLWNHINGTAFYSPAEIGKRYRSIFFLFRDFCNYQAIWNARNSKPCIMDEGMLEKSFMLLSDDQSIIDLVDEYLSLLPLPDSVIYLHATDTSAIVDRLLKRKKVIASHTGKDRMALEKDIERWQFYFTIIMQGLKKYKVPVISIDGLKPIDEKVNILNNLFL